MMATWYFKSECFHNKEGVNNVIIGFVTKYIHFQVKPKPPPSEFLDTHCLHYC